MNKDNPILQLLSNLFDEKIIIQFFIVIAFLLLGNILNKQIRKTVNNRRIAAYCAAFLSSTILLSLYYLIKVFLFFIDKYRFDVPESNLVFPPMGIYVLPFSIAFIYLIYSVIEDRWTRKITKINIRLITEAFVLLILLYIPPVLTQVISSFFGNNYSLDHLASAMAMWAPGPFGAAFAILVYNYYQYINRFRMQQKELQIAQLQQQVAQSQLDALSSKINPHFLYNSLNSIAGLSTEDSVKTREMAIALSKLFKYNINRDENSFASIKDEVEMAVLYLEIEKIRFEERLNYSVSIQPGIEDVLIPRHLLQPLVENAVKHGFGATGIEITIAIEKYDEIIVLKVGDKGNEFDVSFNPGYGIKSLYDKLDILVPNKYEIAFLNNPKEVRIEITGLY